MKRANLIQAAAVAAVIAAISATAVGEAGASVGPRPELHNLPSANRLPRALFDIGRTGIGAARRTWEESLRTIDIIRAKAAR